MEEKNIINNLNKFNPKPSKEWQDSSIQKLREYVVTDSINNRNSSMNLYNFFNILNMNTKFKTTAAIASILAVFVVGSGAVYASNDAKPGDILFPLDKAVEQIRRTVISDVIADAEFEMGVMDERMTELQKMSEEGNVDGISNGISEVEAQQVRLQNIFARMTQLRASGDNDEKERQYQVMEKLAYKLQTQKGVLEQVREKLANNGDESNSSEVEKLQYQYSEQMQNEFSNFEESTGLTIQTRESVQNQGDETQIQEEVKTYAGEENGEGETGEGVQGVQNQNQNGLEE